MRPRRLLRQLDRPQLELELAVAAQHAGTERTSDRVGRHQALDVIDALDGLTAKLDDQVLGPQTRPLRGAAVGHVDNLHAARAAEADAPVGWQWARPARDPDVRAPNAAVAHQRTDDLPRGGGDRG